MRSLAVLSSQRVNGIEPVALIDPAFCADKGMRAGIGYETMEGIPHHYISFGSNLDLQSVPLDQQLMHYAYRASEVVRREQPRVLHANSGRRGYDNAMVALALGWKFNLPVIYEVRSFHEATWTAEVDRAERSELYEKRLAAEEKCLALSDGIVTLSKGMKEDLVARGVPEERIWVIPNAVERERFYPSGRGRQLRREWGIGDAPVLGYVSNLSWREGHDILIRAFNELVREGRDVYCLIVGDGPERSRLEELCKALGVRDRTMFTGTIDREEVAGYYEVIDIFAVPRRDDRAARLVTPLKPFEAMAAGSALVVSDLPALREIVGDGLRGRMFTAGDCRDLARQARVLLENPEKRKRNAESAQAWVESERTWRVNAETYRELYESLVGAK
jgi:glycosyltransferase involved in cell wall biosynthesis